MSPPFPHPMSRTFPEAMLRPPPLNPWFPFPFLDLDAANTGWANRVIRTDLTQLLKFFRPMMGESRRCTTPTSGRELSRKGSAMVQEKRLKKLTVLDHYTDIPSQLLSRWLVNVWVRLLAALPFGCLRYLSGSTAAVPVILVHLQL